MKPWTIQRLAPKVGSYAIISSVCFVTNNLLLIGFNAAGFSLASSLALSALIVISLGFLLQSFFTFGASVTWAAYTRYVLVMLPNLPVAYGLLWLLNGHFGTPMTYSAPTVTTLLLLWNAAGSVWALHRRSPRS